MSNIRTNLPIPTQPWENAKCKFLAGLSAKEAACFNAATPENLFYDADNAQKQHSQKSRSWLMQERMSPLIDAIDDYGKALDVYSNTYGLILCPIWGSLRVILQIAREAGKFQENVVEMLAQIGDVLPRFRIYQTLFTDHERLLVALSNAFLDLLKFCTMTKDFFLGGKKSMIPSSIVLKGAWKPYRQEFENYIKSFRRHCKIVEKEANAAHLIESARIREVQRANHALQLRNSKLQRRHRILSAIATVDYRSKQAKLLASRYPGTNRWIHDTPEFTSWLSSQNSSSLCCYGIPGSGKSVLAASIVQDLSNKPNNTQVFTAYHYFDYAEAISLEPFQVLHAIIKQSIERLPLDHFVDNFRCPFDEGTSTPNVEASLTFLKDLLKSFREVYLVFDGVDQLSSTGQTTFIGIITRLLCEQSFTCKIFATIRLGEQILQKTLQASLTITLPRGCTPDMTLFVNEEINLILRTRSSPLEDSGLRKQVVQALLSGAKGMFLWLRFQLYDIEQATSERAMRNTIDHLPKDLAETYSRIWDRVRSKVRNNDAFETVQRVFRWVACVRRPLTLSELEEAVGLDGSDDYLHLDRLATGSGDKLITSCGNLIIVNEDDFTVNFAHHTVKQWLCESAASGYPSLDGTRFFLQRANMEIAKICIAYLSYSDFETQLIKPSTNHIQLQTAEQVVWFNVPLAKYIKSAITAGSRFGGRTSNDGAEYQYTFALPSQFQPSDILTRKYAMLDYIISNWVYHTAHFTPTSESWSKFNAVVTQKELAFNFRPWVEEEHQSRVQQVFRDFAFPKWQARPIFTGTEGSKSAPVPRNVLLYSYIMIHGHRSLLYFVNQATMVPYIKHYRGPKAHDNIEYHLQTFFQSIFRLDPSKLQNGSFWSHYLIYNIMRDCGDVHSILNLSQSMYNFVRTEHDMWVVEYSHHDPAEMFFEAISLALREASETAFTQLLRFHVKTPAELVKVLNFSLQENHDRSWVIRALLFHHVEESWPPKVLWEFLFALHKCHHMVEPILRAYSTTTDHIGHFTAMALLTLAVGVIKRPSVIQLYQHFTDTRIFTTLDLSPIDWKSTAFGTAELYNALIPLSGSTVFLKVFAIRTISDSFGYYSSRTSLDQDTIRKASNEIKNAGSYFSIEAFEMDGIPCLRRAIEARSIDLVRTLFPLYNRFLEENKNHVKSVTIIDAIMNSGMDFTFARNVIAIVCWPFDVKEAVREQYNGSPFYKQQQWIVDLILAS